LRRHGGRAQELLATVDTGAAIQALSSVPEKTYRCTHLLRLSFERDMAWAGRFHLGIGPCWLRLTYVTPVLVKKYWGRNRPGRDVESLRSARGQVRARPTRLRLRGEIMGPIIIKNWLRFPYVFIFPGPIISTRPVAAAATAFRAFVSGTRRDFGWDSPAWRLFLSRNK
jgi:hypothetical protein